MEAYLPYLAGPASAVIILAVMVWAFYEGKLHSDSEFRKLETENEALRKALDAERTAVNEASRTGTVTNQLITALATVAAQNHQGDMAAREIAKDLKL